MTDSTLNIEINQDKAIRELKELDKGLGKATKSGDKLAKQTKKAGDQAKASAGGFKFLGTAIAAAFSGAAINALAQTIAKFETLEFSLGTVFKSMDRGREVFKDIQVLAEITPFAVEDLTTSVIKLRAAGIEPTTQQLELFSDTASVTTDAVGSLVAITDLFSRTTAGGLGLMDLNRLADRGIPVFDILSQKLGLARLEVVKFGRDAQGSAIILEALTEGLEERFGGASVRSTKLLTTSISNLGDSFDRFLKEIGDAGVLDLFTRIVQQAAVALDWMGANLDTVAVAIAGMATLAIPALIRAVQGLTLAMASNPIGLLVTAISLAIAALYHFRGVIFDTIVKAFNVWIPNAVDHTLIAFYHVKKGIYDVINVVLKGIEDLGNKLIDKTPDFLKGWLGIEGARFSFGIDTTEVVNNIAVLEKAISDRIANYKPPKRPDFFGLEEDDLGGGNGAAGLSTSGSLTGDRINPLETPVSSLPEKELEAQQTAIEQLETFLMTEEEKLFESYANRQFMVDDALENNIISAEKHNDLMVALEGQYQTELTALHVKGYTERQKFAALSTQAQTGQVLDELVNMTAGVAQHNRTLFELNKAAAIPQAIISTYEGMNRALETYPPPLSFAMAAAVAASGFANVAAIKSASFTGGGGTAPSGVTGGPSAPSGEVIQPIREPTPNPEEGKQINIFVSGDFDSDGFRLKVVESLYTAEENDEVRIINAN